MGHFRFQKRIRILPGTWFNLSKSGLSLTSGVPGAHLNLPIVGRRKRHAMSTFSLPGTGLSYRQRMGGSNTTAFLFGLGIVILLFYFFG
jgi:hypothetical protein